MTTKKENFENQEIGLFSRRDFILRGILGAVGFVLSPFVSSSAHAEEVFVKRVRVYARVSELQREAQITATGTYIIRATGRTGWDCTGDDKRYCGPNGSSDESHNIAGLPVGALCTVVRNNTNDYDYEYEYAGEEAEYEKISKGQYLSFYYNDDNYDDNCGYYVVDLYRVVPRR